MKLDLNIHPSFAHPFLKAFLCMRTSQSPVYIASESFRSNSTRDSEQKGRGQGTRKGEHNQALCFFFFFSFSTFTPPFFGVSASLSPTSPFRFLPAASLFIAASFSTFFASFAACSSAFLIAFFDVLVTLPSAPNLISLRSRFRLYRSRERPIFAELVASVSAGGR